MTCAQKPVSVKRTGGYYVGGKNVVLEGLPVEEKALPDGTIRRSDPNGEFNAWHMYVQYTLLESPRSKYPLLLWHGGGLSGSTWEDTPDGRPGWQWYFLSQGHDVYVSDAVERGRANWPRFPEIMPGYPEFREKSFAWNWFRIGERDGKTGRGKPYEGSQFPVKGFDNLCKQTAPRWRESSRQTEEAYDEYLRSFPEGCVVLSHSQGGRFSTWGMHGRPEVVKAHVCLEPFFVEHPRDVLDIKAVVHIPQLFIWGDYVDLYPAWTANRRMGMEYLEALKSAGADVTLIDLPSRGIRGNSHMIHNDANSDEVAGIVQEWMRERNLMR